MPTLNQEFLPYLPCYNNMNLLLCRGFSNQLPNKLRLANPPAAAWAPRMACRSLLASHALREVLVSRHLRLGRFSRSQTSNLKHWCTGCRISAEKTQNTHLTIWTLATYSNSFTNGLPWLITFTLHTYQWPMAWRCLLPLLPSCAWLLERDNNWIKLVNAKKKLYQHDPN